MVGLSCTEVAARALTGDCEEGGVSVCGGERWWTTCNHCLYTYTLLQHIQ